MSNVRPRRRRAARLVEVRIQLAEDDADCVPVVAAALQPAGQQPLALLLGATLAGLGPAAACLVVWTLLCGGMAVKIPATWNVQHTHDRA